MTSKSKIKLAAAALMLLIGVTMLVNHVAVGPDVVVARPEQAYFFDLQTGALYTAPIDTLSPTDAPSGADNGVRAIVYTCGTCDEGQQKIGYLQMMSPRGKEIYVHVHELGPDVTPDLVTQLEQESFVALPPEAGGEPQWVNIATPQEDWIMQSYRSACGEKGRPRRCNPSP